jgi:hypothetical protein
MNASVGPRDIERDAAHGRNRHALRPPQRGVIDDKLGLACEGAGAPSRHRLSRAVDLEDGRGRRQIGARHHANRVSEAGSVRR